LASDSSALSLGYATLSTLVGIDPSDIFDGHEVDSLDMWPLLTGTNKTNPREYLPVTEQTLIWKGQYKYYSQSWAIGFNGWSMINNTMIEPPPASEPRGGTFCKRCLFDLLADEGEHVNIAADYSNIVNQLEAQLATYKYIVGPNMTTEELEDYECTPPPLTPEVGLAGSSFCFSKSEHSSQISTHFCCVQEREGWPSKWPWTSTSPTPYENASLEVFAGPCCRRKAT
jgi:hypothetical protein